MFLPRKAVMSDLNIKDKAAAEKARERKADEIVKRFQAGLPKNAPSPHDVLAEMYDERGLPKS